MAWNTGTNKSLDSGFSQLEKKVLSVGAPVVYNPGAVGKPYRDGWNIERAYKDGVASITWVFRAIDAIASNQARLPAMLRKGNSFDGEVVSTDNTNFLEVMNSVANIGESSFAFRYRLSSQLLMSTRGVFIEVVKNNAGKVDSMHLLPPQDTSPIPHPTKFVSGFEVELGDGNKRKIDADKVIWIRKPHPLDPYRSITPMEAAGIAIEIEQLAKVYNRNFLLNDGRPGGLIVLHGEIDTDDREELEARFRGGPRRAGAVSVISSEDGADFIDTGASPRDLAYAEMRSVTKEEILSAFGVPESIIGNASGRTFSNAAEEGRVFWQETMSPHIQLIARDFDKLADNNKYVDFNTDAIPILILAKQEREQYLLQEFNAGLTTANEYRNSTGRKKVESELADSMLANPNLTPIGNTEKALPPLPDPNADPNAAVPGQEQAGLGGDGQVPLDVLKGDFPVVDSSANPDTFAGVPDDASQLTDVSAGKSLETKEFIEFETKALSDVEKWQDVFEGTLGRFFERQQRVVMEKARSKKTSRGLADGTLDIDTIFDSKVWCKQLDEDLRPVIYGAYEDAAKSIEIDFDEIDKDELKVLADEQVDRACKLNKTTAAAIAMAIVVAKGLKDETVDEREKFLHLAVGAVYVEAETDRKSMIAENEAFTSYNSGLYAAGHDLDTDGLTKTWVSQGDEKVRGAHAKLHGKTVKFGDEFAKGLRFPGDPSAPPEQTINCRCILMFDFDS